MGRWRNGRARWMVRAAVKLFREAPGVPFSLFFLYVLTVKVLRLLVKRGYLFEYIISASRAHCALYRERVTADRALTIGVLLQNVNGS